MSQEVVVPKERISLWECIAAIVSLFLIFLCAYVTQTMVMAKYWAIGFWLSFIWPPIIVATIGKISPRLVMNKNFFVLLMIFMFVNSSKAWFAGSPTEASWVTTLAGSFQAAVAARHFPKGAMDILEKLVPDWILPRDYDATARYYFGSGEPIWEPLIGCITAWSIILVAIFLISLPMCFLIFGPKWYEDERLLFPAALPTVYVINNIYPTEEAKEFGRLFQFKGVNRVFWIMFIVGLILNAPNIIQQIIPAIPFGTLFVGGGYGHIQVLFTSWFPILTQLLPGADLNVAIMLPIIPILVLLPFDFLLTFIIFRILFGFVYNVSAIKLGIVATSPGTTGPFPWMWIFGQGGAIIGFGIYAFWSARDRIKRALSSFSKDYEVDGISMRSGMIIMIVGIIMLLGILIASGMDPLTTILWFVLATLGSMAGTRIAAEVYTYWIGWHGIYNWQLIHPIGVSLGLWGYPPQRNTSLAMMGLSHGLISGNPGPYANNGALQQSYLILAYAVAKGTNCNMRKIFYLMLIATVVFIPATLIFDVWFMSHVGVSNTGAAATTIFPFNIILNSGLNTGIEAMQWAMTRPPLESWGWAIVGSIIILGVAYLRTIFPWFFIHPTGLVLAAMHPYWIGWLCPIIALIIKFIMLRTLGAKRTSEIIMPFYAGLVAGFAILYTFIAIYCFFTISLPNLTMLWK